MPCIVSVQQGLLTQGLGHGLADGRCRSDATVAPAAATGSNHSGRSLGKPHCPVT